MQIPAHVNGGESMIIVECDRCKKQHPMNGLAMFPFASSIPCNEVDRNGNPQYTIMKSIDNKPSVINLCADCEGKLTEWLEMKQ